MTREHAKRILVTGGARRLGARLAERLAVNGHEVIIHANSNAAAAETMCVRLREAGARAWAVTADLADMTIAGKVVERASDVAGGPLSGLVNSASLFDYDTPQNVNTNIFDRVMAVNLRAPMLLADRFAAQADRLADNCIVNVLDQKLWAMNPDFYSYTVSKAGLLAATDMMARAFAPAVRVNAVAPGLLLPSHDQTAEEFAMVAARNLLQRQIDPEDVAASIEFLMSNRSMTGQVIHADNGQRFTGGARDVMFDPRDRK